MIQYYRSFTMRFREELQKLNEIDDDAMLPSKVGEHELVTRDDDLNKRLMAKINVIAKGLADAFADEGIDLDAQLIVDDIKRDCGLMGDVISTDELDVENNPFDAATKQMHDMGPVDVNMACQTLLDVPPHEFVAVIINGLKRGRGLLPGGPDGRRALPHRPAPRRIGESREEVEEKDYSYINSLIDKYKDEVKIDEELLTEKIQDLKAYFKKNLKDKFTQLGLTETDFMKIAALDPTYKKESPNKAGDYIEWLVRMITKNVMTYAQMMHIGREWTDSLGLFDEYKKKNKLPADKKDIMKFKTFDEFFSFLQSLGGDITVDAEEGTSFRQAIQNIRGALVAICGFRDDEIPSDIQNTEDALTFCGEANGWELYKINSIWGAMLADTYGIDWGAGATWCTGGQYMYVGEPRKGMELLRSAQQHYPGYTRNGATLYVFANTNNSILRPHNKVQLTLAGDGYKVSGVFHANDRPLRLSSDGTLDWSDGWGSGASGDSTVLSAFMKQEGLISMVKNSPLGRCESIKDAETAERLARGEPYEYGGERIKDMFKPDIKEVVFTEDYNFLIRSRNRAGEPVEIVGIPPAAFANCTNLKLVTIPAKVLQVGIGAFKGCEKVKIVIPRFPDREFKFYPSEQAYFEQHLYYDDGQKVFGGSAPEAEEPEEDEE